MNEALAEREIGFGEAIASSWVEILLEVTRAVRASFAPVTLRYADWSLPRRCPVQFCAPLTPACLPCEETQIGRTLASRRSYAKMAK